MEHGYRNAAGQYYNGATGKFVVRLRPTARGKAKGNASTSRLEGIKERYPHFWKSHGWLPISLSKERLASDAGSRWKYGISFELDRAIALSTLLIITRNSASEKKRRSYYYQEGWTNVSTRKMKKWVHSTDYHKYVQHFVDMGYLMRDEGYSDGNFPMQYKWRHAMVTKAGDPRRYHRVEYTKPDMLVKAFQFKIKRLEEAKQLGVRTGLVGHVETICRDFDAEGFTQWALANPAVFAKKKKHTDLLDQYLIRVSRFKSGDMYFNTKDEYGERFHSVFTNSKKEVRNFIRIDGQPAVEVDIKNSQFFFLALLTLYPKQSKEILKGVDGVAGVVELMQYYYENKPDYRAFVDSALDGTLYEESIRRFAQVGRTVKKKWVKDLFFKAIFSQETECQKAKQKLSEVYPTLVRLGNIVNRERALLPKILQIYESRLVLDRIALKALDQGEIFTVIHDSFLCTEETAPMFRFLIKQTFAELGLPAPKSS